MNALSKTPVSPETAQTLLRSAFGPQARLHRFTELTDGMYNAAYLLELADGFRTVLKVAPPDHVTVMRYEKKIMQAEVDVLRLLRAHTEVPVPEVLLYDTSRRLLDNDYYLMAFVPGVSLHRQRPQLSAAVQAQIDFRTGEYLRQINAITGPRFGYYAQPASHRPTWRESFALMVDHVLQDGREAGVDLPVTDAELRSRLHAHAGVLDEVTQPVLVHWDLWDGNIFVDPETHVITGILDCERALWGDPLMEVNFGAFGLNPALLAGYGRAMLDTPNARRRRTLYNLYLWLIMIIECTYRQYPTRDQEMWARQKLMAELDLLDAQAVDSM